MRRGERFKSFIEYKKSKRLQVLVEQVNKEIQIINSFEFDVQVHKFRQKEGEEGGDKTVRPKPKAY